MAPGGLPEGVRRSGARRGHCAGSQTPRARARSTATLRRWGLVSALLLLASATASPFGAAPAAAADVAVYDDGPYMLVRYTLAGETLGRLTGFSAVADLTLYDGDTVLVVETERDRISAVDVGGRVLWTISLPRPTCIEVLERDRFLVCHDDPPGISEMSRDGTVFWTLTEPLREAAGAVRLPDGNTAVVEGRGPHAVHVFSPDGRRLWSGTQHLARPRGLALLPGGELATAGFDSGRGVIFRPYTDEVRVFEYGGHGEDLTVTADGDLLAFSPERQTIRAWRDGEEIRWEFSTLYPVYHGVQLGDGTILASVHRMPDAACPNAAEAERPAAEPRPHHLRWMLVGMVLAALMTAVARRDVFASLRRAGGGRSEAVPSTPSLAVARRFEIGAYVLLAAGLGTLAVRRQPTLPGLDEPAFWTYAALTVAAGVALALAQVRTPPPPGAWAARLPAAPPMAQATAAMWVLWALGAVLVAGTVACVVWENGPLGIGLFAAGIVLLLGGSLEPARAAHRWSRGEIALLAAVIAAAALPRLYRLDEFPANLHLDMAQWSVQVFALLDDRPRTLFTNGWAEIPMIGYLWSGLWTAIGGRTLAGARLASAAGGVLAIVVTYALARRLYGLCAALVVAALLVVNHGFVHFSRIQSYMDPIPFQVLAVLGVLAGVECGRYAWFAVAGVAGGLSALAYHSGRITPPLLALLLGLLVLWYPRTVLRRWRGIVLFAATLGAMLAPQAAVYLSARATPYGRAEMYAWVRNGEIDYELLRATLEEGVPRVLGTFWFYFDAASQYGAHAPAFFPPMATLLGMAVVAALLRPRDFRGLWLLAWGMSILAIGGILTLNPPFWPRLFGAFVPAALACAVAVDALWRGARAAAGRAGGPFGAAAVAALLALIGWQHLGFYQRHVLGIPAGGSAPTMRTEWTQSIMGRDLRRWGRDAVVYIVAPNPIEHSCRHPTMQFYDYGVDTYDARLVQDYLPFTDPRTAVIYFAPASASQADLVVERYPDTELTTFTDNLGQTAFVRAVVPPRPDRSSP